MTELSTAYGPSCVSYDTARRWKKNLNLVWGVSKMHQHQDISFNLIVMERTINDAYCTKCILLIVILLLGFTNAGSPYISNNTCGSYSSVPEDFIGTICRIHIQDSDKDDNITVKPDNDITAQYFSFNPAGNENDVWVNITTVKGLDRETLGGTVTMKLLITDKQFNEVGYAHTIYTNDVNDNSPEFQNLPYTLEIPELPCNKTIVYSNIKATDKDQGSNGTVSYSMVPKAQSNESKKAYRTTFSINNTTGAISLNKCLDYETNSYYQFTVMAKDGGPNGGRNSTAEFIIRVQDVQDKPPFFTGIPYMDTIYENTKSNSLIKITAQDGDPGVSNTVFYKITASTCDTVFKIDNTSGVISTKTSNLDRDSGTIKSASGNCVVTVEAKESDSSKQPQYGNTTATTNVSITVKDLDDNSPKFKGGNYTANITENAPKNVPITLSQEIFVSDIDQDPKNAKMKITLRNEDNTACTDFEASPEVIQGSGNVLILVNNSSFLDYEIIQNTTIKVIATEEINKTKTDEVTVTISIIDMNDVSPKFNNTSFNLKVKENTGNGTIISQITATDGDRSSQFKKLSYSINGGNNRFIVDADTGNILVNCSNCTAQLDREKQNVYYMTYTAKDVDNRSDSSSLIIELTDENDNAPKFLSHDYKIVVDENLNDSSPLINIEARDDDEENTNNSLVTYSIIETSPKNLEQNNFTINPTNGALTLKTRNGTTTFLDYEKLLETEGKINITVQAEDRGNPPKKSTTIVHLHVQDKNDNTPKFNSTQYNTKVPEDATSTENNYTKVGQVYASDNDGTERNKKLNYIIKSGGSDRFTIESMTGVVNVQLNAKLDREMTPNYTLEILAVDQGYPPRNGSTTMFIEVTDVNDSPPRFNQSEYAVSVKENADHMMAVITCPATDPDLNSSLIYTITQIKARDEMGEKVNTTLVSKYFGIHANNGTVYVSGDLDRETASVVIITLQVNDTKAKYNKPQTATATLTIQLEDVNDNQPIFTNQSYTFSIIENAQNGAILGSILATDRDINRTITYNLTGESSKKFKIDSKTGTLSKTGELDRETYPIENLTVTATDNGIPTKSSMVNVTISVGDFNDNPPIFKNNFNTTIFLLENSTIGTNVLTVQADDKDEGPNKNITYYIIIDEKNYPFNINLTTGVITVKHKIDRENTSEYSFLIRARDNPIDTKEQKSTDITIKVILDDINDNSPNFTQTKYSVSIEENKPNGTVITTVTATDKDQGMNAKISYKMENSSESKLFSIDANNGIIKAAENLTDKIGYYNLTVIAYDQGDPKLNGTADLYIEVIDLNNHKPEIKNIPDGKKISVYECARLGATIHTFNYTDADFADINKEATFKVVNQGNDSSAFNLTLDGKLVVRKKLDVLIQKSYSIEIQATDKGSPALPSDILYMTVNILDVNDHVPSFTNNLTTLTLPENTTFTHNVGQVKAIDEDSDSKLCYEPKQSNWTEYFNINRSDGEIFIVKKLDYERSHSIEFEIKVNDCSLDNLDNNTHCDVSQTSIIKKNQNIAQTTTKVVIAILDADDNPPVFKQKHLATGMRRNTEADTELELHLRNNSYISDADSPEHGVLAWTFSNCRNITVSPELQDKIKHDSGEKTCEDGIKHIFCITKNGTILNNKFFSEDLSGYFVVTVNVSDKAGFDTANVTIYLISDSQVITMTIRDPKEHVAASKDNLLSELSQILGYTAVFDSIQDHRENGVLNPQRSDLKFHLVEPSTQAVLSGEASIELFDKQANNGEMINLQNNYHVMKVTQHDMGKVNTEEGSKKLTLILVAVSVAEALIITIIIFVALSARNKFRRKLKAAVINTPDMELHALEQKEAAIPGSNLYSKQNNPLLNADIKHAIQDPGVDDAIEPSFEDVDLDENVVDDNTTVYDTIEEKEATMDMYNDDTFHSISSEDLLDATLNLHAMRKSRESLDNIDDDDHAVNHPTPNTTATFINETYMEDLESTEI